MASCHYCLLERYRSDLMPPRRSLKKHDAAAESHTLKTRRQRTTTQVRKDKRHTTVQIKRRHLVSTSCQPALSGRSIAELIGCLGDANNASTVTLEERFEALREIRGLLAITQEKKDGEHDIIEQLIESGVRIGCDGRYVWSHH